MRILPFLLYIAYDADFSLRLSPLLGRSFSLFSELLRPQ